MEHQARQNISTLNFTAAFAKTSSSCNATLEKCQYSLKSTFKKVKSQIQKGANPEKAAKRGYEQACEYLDVWRKNVLIQHRALTCLSKSLAHILQREPQSTSRRLPPFFQKRLANKQMFIQRVKHYHQWLRAAIHFKTKSSQIPSDSVRIQGPSKRPSSGHLYPVSCVKERNRKGGKCKISRVLQSPVSSPQASPKVEAGHRLKQAQHFSTHRKVQNGNSRVHQDLSDSRGMGIVDRRIRRLPSHPHAPKFKKIPDVLPQVAGVPVHPPPFRTSHSPPGLYNDCKGSGANGPLQRTQTSPIPG